MDANLCNFHPTSNVIQHSDRMDTPIISDCQGPASIQDLSRNWKNMFSDAECQMQMVGEWSKMGEQADRQTVREKRKHVPTVSARSAANSGTKAVYIYMYMYVCIGSRLRKITELGHWEMGNGKSAPADSRIFSNFWRWGRHFNWNVRGPNQQNKSRAVFGENPWPSLACRPSRKRISGKTLRHVNSNQEQGKSSYQIAYYETLLARQSQ